MRQKRTGACSPSASHPSADLLGKFEIGDEDVVIRCHRRHHRLANEPQRRVIKNVIEHVRLAAPGNDLLLSGAKTNRPKLSHQISVVLYVEIAGENCRPA